MRSDVLMLIAAAAFLPIVYLGVLYYYRECFTQECNKKRRFLRSMPEIIGEAQWSYVVDADHNVIRNDYSMHDRLLGKGGAKPHSFAVDDDLDTCHGKLWRA